MWGYVGRRLVLAIPTLLGASVIVFAMVHLAPGDPIAAVLPVDASKQQIEEIKKAYGFDRPLPVQYLKWLGHVVTGDLGLRGTTRQVQVPLTFNGVVTTRMGVAAGFSGDLTLKLSDFGVPFTREFEPGRRVVGDELKVELQIEAKPRQ